LGANNVADYSLKLNKPNLTYQCYIPDFIGFTTDKTVNSVGQFTLELPPYYRDIIQDSDYILEVERNNNPNKSGQALPGLLFDTAWLLVKDVYTESDEAEKYTATFYCANDLIRRRIIPYYANTAFTSKTFNYSDNFLKEIARQNLGPLASSYAGISNAIRSYSSLYFQVSGDTSQSVVTMSKNFAWKGVMETMQEICRTSNILGSYLAYDVVYNRQGKYFEFRTYTGQRGLNRSAQVTFRRNNLSIQQATLTRDWTNEANDVYCGGKGEDFMRIVQRAPDAARVQRSPFARREEFIDARNNGESNAAVLAEAQAMLRQSRPLNLLEVKLAQTPDLSFGYHYNYGDRVRAEFKNKVFDARIEQVRIAYNPANEQGRENIDIVLRSNTDL
jgi:Siphovirus ReqiPepy6 Gp37-like protein